MKLNRILNQKIPYGIESIASFCTLSEANWACKISS